MLLYSQTSALMMPKNKPWNDPGKATISMSPLVIVQNVEVLKFTPADEKQWASDPEEFIRVRLGVQRR